MKIRDIGEIGLIKRIAKNIRCDKSVVRGIGDDTAVIDWTKDKYLLFTCDMIIQDVHFKLGKATPFQIGWKAMARNVSDIAAMGGMPKYVLVSMGLPPKLPVAFVDGIYKGMKAVATKFRTNIVGGDTSRSNKIVIDISMLGEVERRNLVTRSGARKGDVIMVTGGIGGSIKGRHLSFKPRLDEARMLVKNFKVSSMIDVSDGLAIDLWRILDASRVGGRIYENAIPVSRDADSFEKAIRDGEDFELLFTMSAKEAKSFFKKALAKIQTPVTLIGEILDKKDGYTLVASDGSKKRLSPKGYLHF